MTITICGGGNLGHVLLGVLSANKKHTINLLTNRPEDWSHQISVEDCNNRRYVGNLTIISSHAEDVIPQADMVIICLPGFAIKEVLLKIKRYLTPQCKIGSIVAYTGFFFMAKEVLEKNAQLFGFQRVPYVARITEYGRSAQLLGYKTYLYVAVENISDTESFRQIIESLFATPTQLLTHYLEASLSNSNPLLHTARLYSMWNSWKKDETYNRQSLFYEEWTEDTSDLLICMDNEFMGLLDKLPINKKNIPSILDYYESSDAQSLTAKIRSIEAFKTIKSPMRLNGSGWIPDFNSRYFTEDFAYGLKFIKDTAAKQNMTTPFIDMVYNWGINILKEK